MAQRVSVSDPAATAVKALEIVERLSTEGGEGLGLNEIARHIGSSRTSAIRLLAALQQKHLVVQHPTTRRYRLTLHLLELGTAVLDQIELPNVAKPHLNKLSQTTGECALLGLLDGSDVVVVARAEPPDPLYIRARVGSRFPSHCTGLGKALLAGLPDPELESFMMDHEFRRYTGTTFNAPEEFSREIQSIRARGFAVDREEHRKGVSCVASPVRDHSGTVVAAVSVSGPTFRMCGDGQPSKLADQVRRAAGLISAELGGASAGC